MLNQLILQGRLTKDVESRETARGVKFYNFTLATDNRSKDESTFINCTAFDNVGANLVKYCGKGDMICVIGAINQRRYTTKDGEDRSVIEVLVNSVEFLQPKKEEPKKEEIPPFDDLPNEAAEPLVEVKEELPELPKGWHYEDGKPVKDAPSKKNAPSKK